MSSSVQEFLVSANLRLKSFVQSSPLAGFRLRSQKLPLFAALSALLLLVSAAGAQTPISGQPVASLSQLDTIMQTYMTQYSSPGASLSVTVDGRLVFARGYGYADLATGEFAQPDSLYRIASNSKPITAAGIYKLIEQGHLSLTTKPFVDIPGLASLTPPSGSTVDPRYYNITVQELLQHDAGFDDSVPPYDPAFVDAVTAATAFGAAAPATPQLLIKYILGQSLQHDPGVEYHYSNMGYIILGYIIEQVSGESYAKYIQDNVFTPAGIVRTQPGASLLSGRLPNEVAYYDYPNAPLVSSVEQPVGSQVPYPYGGYSCALNLANGCWVSSPMDLLRFTDSINGQFATNIFATPPASSPFRSPAVYFAVPPTGTGWEYVFYGSLPGTNSLVHLNSTTAVHGRVTYSAIFNTRDGSNIEEPESDADNAISAFVKTVSTWPSGDLFPNYAGTASSCSFTLGASSQSAVAAGVSQTVSVTDANYCAWSAVSNSSWLHVTAGALNSDSGSVGYTADANTGGARSGTIAIAGQTFTVNQLSGVTATSTTLSVGASTTNATAGQQVTFTATLAPYSAGSNTTNGETVTFYNGSTMLGTGTLSSGIAHYATTTLTGTTNSITAQYAGDTNFAGSNATPVVVNVTKTAATVTLGSLAATYDGNSHAATATTTPSGLTVTFTYNGSATAPSAAGSYAVVGTINDPTYSGTGTGTLVISQRAVAVTLGSLAATYDGTAHAATSTTTPAGVSVGYTYNGSATVPVAAGSYAVVATVTDPNSTGTANGTLVIAKGTATVTLGSLSASHDGNPHAASATTTPAGLNVTFTYNGSGTAPSANGSYTVVATVNDANYTGSATGTLVISNAIVPATITLGNLAATYDGTAHAATATTNPTGVSVSLTYNGSATVPVAAGSYAVVATVTDPNYTGSATGTLVIAKATATVALGNLAAVYDGNPHAATATTTPAGLAVSLTYGGSSTVPSAAGSYAVVATVNDANYTGSGTGSLVISKNVSGATITLGSLTATYNASPHAATATTTPAGLNVTFTYNGSATAPTGAGSYAVVATISDPNYAGSSNGTLVIAKAAATLTLGGLSATADGNPHAATGTTSPSGLAVTFTYNGSATAPTAVGSYTVVGTINDPNYTGSATGTLVLTPPIPDFTFTPTGSGSLTIPAGGTGSYIFGLAPTLTALPGPVTFSASGLPAGATATFTPATATGNTQSVTMTITLSAVTQSLNRLKGIPTVAFALLLFPFAMNRKIRLQLKKYQGIALLFLLGLVAAGAMTGCGSGEGFFQGQNQRSYNVTVTATSGALQHSTNVTLNVQ